MITQLLEEIAEGMEVYDSEGNRIGTVAGFRAGEGSMKSSHTDIITMSEAVEDALGGKKNLPTVIYTRLYEEGFVRVKRGFLRSDAIAFTDQIDKVEGSTVYLKAPLSELMKR